MTIAYKEMHFEITLKYSQKKYIYIYKMIVKEQK